MRSIRARLAAYAIALLVCQGSALVAAPGALCRGVASAAVEDVDECCQHLAPGQTCPMHHKSPDSSERRGPSWTCVCSPSGAALVSLLGFAGSLPPPVQVMFPPARVEVIAPSSSSTEDRSQPPSSPPPRA